MPPPVGRWGEREQGILQVATALYAQGGYENITMAAVASAAGLSEGTLYNYFRDKQDLQLRVSLGVFEAYTLEMEKVVAGSKSLRHGLEGIIAVELRLLIDAKELFRIWLREMRSASGYAHSEARNALRRFSTHLIHLFAKWNAAPDPRLGLNLPLLRDIVFGSLEHIVWTAMVQRREDAIDVRGCRAIWLAPTCGRSIWTAKRRMRLELQGKGRGAMLPRNRTASSRVGTRNRDGPAGWQLAHGMPMPTVEIRASVRELGTSKRCCNAGGKETARQHKGKEANEVELLQLIVGGVAQGCVYGLIALGFVLIYKATEMVNFAQGDLMMLGSFVALTFIGTMGMNYWLGVLVAALAHGRVRLSARCPWCCDASSGSRSSPW